MRYENPRPVYPNELYHHGILGQHWGETNGPPYPLGSGAHNRVVRQGRAERKAARMEKRENKAAFRDAQNDLYRTAYHTYYAKSLAKGANRKAEKSAMKAYKGEKQAAKASERAANAKYENKRADFWQKQYKEKLANYRKAAEKAGKKAKFDESDFSIRRAAGQAMRANTSASIAGQAFGGILGNLVMTAVTAHGTGNRLSEYRRNAERTAGFGKTTSNKSNNSPKHTGNNKTNAKAASSGTGSRSAASEKNAIMKEMTSRFGNSEKNRAALAELKTMLKTTKGEYNKNTETTTYVTQYGIFDVYPGPNGTMRVAFND